MTAPGQSARIGPMASTPLPSGRPRSSRTTSHRSSVTRAIVPAIVSTSTISRSRKSCRRRRRIAVRTIASSSTIRMRAIASLDQPSLQSIAHQLGAALEIHLVEDARTISTDRLLAEVEQRADLLHRLAGGDELEHLELAVRQELVRRTICAARKILGQLLGQ